MAVTKHKILNLPNVDNARFREQCYAYASLVSYWNTIINLVSGRHVDNLLTDLINQSVYPLAKERISERARLLDVGSGAGFPALPLKFARPDFSLTLLEPRRKKASFLRRVIEEFELESTEVVGSRIQEVSGNQVWQARFDLITTRGTGDAAALYPYMRPLVKPGGVIWFYKGRSASTERGELSKLHAGNVDFWGIDRKMSVLVVRF